MKHLGQGSAWRTLGLGLLLWAAAMHVAQAHKGSDAYLDIRQQPDATAATMGQVAGPVAPMQELQLGNPSRLATDVGPVIDAEAQAGILSHIEAMRARGCNVFQAHDPALAGPGTFVPPTLIEIERMDQLEREVFGPVLHVLRYVRTGLPKLLEDINATGYGLTLGVHTRIDETIAQILASAHAGNAYVNRNMVGAVVGVQPFGGEGLSGTGPKAGGPLYLRRLSAHACADLRSLLTGSEPEAAPAPNAALQALQTWAKDTGRRPLNAQRFTSRVREQHAGRIHETTVMGSRYWNGIKLNEGTP